VGSAPRFAHADNVDELTKTLASSSDKARISAVTALARMDDKRALKPLVTALHDPNATVRLIAAAGLGRLGHKAALPSLRQVAVDDADDRVRAAAKVAAVQVAKTNHIADEPLVSAEQPIGAQKVVARGGRPGFGHSGHAVENHPDLYVVMNSASDDSPGSHDKAERKVHGEILKATLATRLARSPQVTMAAQDASRWGLESRHVDLSVVKMDVTTVGAQIEIETQLRLAISDDKGRMMSFLSGGAKLQVPKRTFKSSYLPNLRKEVLETAMNGMFDKLLAQMRKTDV
jgi:hypothetical protein